jgi:hypothetical protein
MALVDSYSESNQNVTEGTFTARPALGQSFTGNGGTLDTTQLYLSKSNSPAGSAYAKIYAHSGTFGTDSIPTGAVLATSGAFDVSTLTTSLQLITFTFTAGDKITLTNGTKYILVVEYSAGNGTNFISWGTDGSSPTHGGNISRYTSGSWGADSSRDFCFYVYDDTPATTTSTTTSTTTTSTSTTSTSSSTTTIPYSLEFFGMKVSKLNIDVLKTNEPQQLIFSSNYGTLKYYKTGSIQFTIDGDLDGGLDSVGQATVNHNLGYYPYFEVYVLNTLGEYEYCPTYNGGAGTTWRIYTLVTTTQLKVYAVISGFSQGGVSFTFKYFIFKNNLNL